MKDKRPRVERDAELILNTLPDGWTGTRFQAADRMGWGVNRFDRAYAYLRLYADGVNVQEAAYHNGYTVGLKSVTDADVARGVRSQDRHYITRARTRATRLHNAADLAESPVIKKMLHFKRNEARREIERLGELEELHNSIVAELDE